MLPHLCLPEEIRAGLASDFLFIVRDNNLWRMNLPTGSDFGLTGFADFISTLFLRSLSNFFTAPSLFGIFLLRHGVNSFALNFGVYH
jgi:hypothetical protein